MNAVFVLYVYNRDNAPSRPPHHQYTTPIQELGKDLHALLVRFPLAYVQTGAVLSEHGLRWTGQPRRATPGTLDRRCVV